MPMRQLRRVPNYGQQLSPASDRADRQQALPHDCGTAGDRPAQKRARVMDITGPDDQVMARIPRAMEREQSVWRTNEYVMHG
jgi:hypothetical protein